jgi:anti-sigma B factor antagonist
MGVRPVTAFSMQVESVEGECRLLVSGEVDLSVSGELTNLAIQCAHETNGADLVIDLGEVSFIDSTGLAGLVAVRNAANDIGRDVSLANVGDRVAKILQITALDRVFAIRRVEVAST